MKFLSFTISRIFYLFVIVLSVTKDHPRKANYLGMLFERSSKSFHNSALCTLHFALYLPSALCPLSHPSTFDILCEQVAGEEIVCERRYDGQTVGRVGGGV